MSDVVTSQASASSSEPMEPTRNPEVTLPDLITVLLDKGTYLNLDLIIAVADIPLIGINLRATIAGMETMLEYGMMREWDEKTRAWVQQSVARNFPLAEEEEVIAKMAGGHFEQGFSDIWRPGSVYVTNQRLVVFRRDPKEVLWETALHNITELRLSEERTIGSEVRTRLLVLTDDGETTLLSAAAPARIRELVGQQRPVMQLPEAGSDASSSDTTAGPYLEGHAWYLETRAQGTTWRGGTALLDHQRFTWQSPTDARPAVNLKLEDISDVYTLNMKTPSGPGPVLHLATKQGSVHLAVANLNQWHQLLAAQIAHHDTGGGELHARNR